VSFEKDPGVQEENRLETMNAESIKNVSVATPSQRANFRVSNLV